MIGALAKLIFSLSGNTRGGEIASGLSFGLWLALVPGDNAIWVILFLIAFFLKHNTAAMLLGTLLFKTFIFLFDPLLDRLGAAVLEAPALQGLFTSFYNLPLIPFSGFNNTLVMGGFLAGALLWVPLFFLFRLLVRLFRKRLSPLIAESKPVKIIGKIPFVSKLVQAVRKVAAYA